MRQFRLRSLRTVRAQADGAVVRREHARHRLPGHLLLHQAHRPSGRRVGRAARADEGHLREARHPRGRAQVPGRRHRAVRVRGRVPPQPGGPRGSRASCSATWTPRCASTPTWSSSTSAPSSRRATTSSPPSTRRSGRAARSSTSRRASTCEMPLQAYFRINSENAGQFERTLIIADEGSKVHYIEGCSAPVYTSDSLHSAVVEIVVKPSARVTYTTIQNWSPERLQPGHQAGPGRDRGPHGVDRRQHRLEAHDEVPVRRTWWVPRPPVRCSAWPTPVRASTRTPGPR